MGDHMNAETEPKQASAPKRPHLAPTDHRFHRSLVQSRPAPTRGAER